MTKRIALSAASLGMAAPLLWTLLLSFKPNDELLRGTQTALQPPFTVQNYADILGHSAVFGWLLNSAIVSLLYSTSFCRRSFCDSAGVLGASSAFKA